MGKSCPGKKSHPLKQANFSKRLAADNLSNNSVCACSDCLALPELSGLDQPKSIGPARKVNRLVGSPF